jgi:hypothetical protein
MNSWQIYAKDVENLLQDKKFSEAYARVNQGLEKMNNHVHLLVVATDICRAWGHHDKSLEYSQLLVAHHPGDWYGYARVAQDLLALDRLMRRRTQFRRDWGSFHKSSGC